MSADAESSQDKAAGQQDADRGQCLCLSGGGFRATLFHLGAVQRLNELGVLSRLSTVTSVSGGSIISGFLAARWERLALGANGVFTNLDDEIAKPVRDFCAKDLRTPLVLGTRLNPFNLPALFRDWFSLSANFLAEAYEPVFRCLLTDLPDPGKTVPRFVFCATNVDTGACWHFHGGPSGQMGDYYSGYCETRGVRLSDAVAASSAFPLAFSALRLRLPTDCKITRIDPWGEERSISLKRGDQSRANAGDTILLTDGGVYDNLAVEPVWNRYSTMYVSDAGQPFHVAAETGQDVYHRLRRISAISMEQVAAVRRRWFVQDLVAKRRTGAAWALNSRLEDFPAPDRYGYDEECSRLLHAVRTDLNEFSEGEIACLENHGYSLADAAVRSYATGLCPNIGARFQWPNVPWSDSKKTAAALSGSARRRITRDIWRYLFRRD